jgi:uncharacterized protein YceK
MCRWWIAALVVAGCCLSGCGTCADILVGHIDPEGPFFYRGVRTDIDTKSYVLFADIPFSAVADTLLIPCGCYAMAYAHSHPYAPDQKEFMLPAGSANTEPDPPAPASPQAPKFR